MMANYYDEMFQENTKIQIPVRHKSSTHVFHQYTLKVKNGLRNDLQKFLKFNKIPSMIYYPFPLYRQPAFGKYVPKDFSIPNVENLCNEVISIPIHTEMNAEHMKYICDKINNF
jgi:dTDP-4-amino-4,6-dideoxygalactose transaminase